MRELTVDKVSGFKSRLGHSVIFLHVVLWYLLVKLYLAEIKS